MDVVARAAPVVDLPDKIEETGIHSCWLVPAPVAQEAVDLGEAAGIEPAVAFERDCRAFSGVGEEQLERSVALGGGKGG